MVDLQRDFAGEHAGDAGRRVDSSTRVVAVSFTVVSALATQVSEPSKVTPEMLGSVGSW